jgi:hypothetical protein
MKSIKKNTKLSINISKEGDDNNFLFCWNKFGDRPNKIKIYQSYSKNHFNEVIDKYTVEKSFSSEVIPADEFDIINDVYFIKVSETIYISYILLDRESDSSFIHEISFYFKSYQDDSQLVDEITNELINCQVDFEDDDETCSKLNTIYITPTGLEIEAISRVNLDDSTELFFNEKTLKSVNKLCKTIKKSDKGLTILYGERGTGKTSVVSYITDKVDRMVIYIPNSLLEATLNNSEFRSFLRKFHRPIIVIDDCEMIFNELFTKSNIYVNNLLQMVEGLLSDSMKVNFITIFNVEDESEIDHALLECNSLIDVIEFEYLNEEESNELSKHLGHSKKYKNKTKLIDIIRKTNSKEYKKIGLN